MISKLLSHLQNNDKNNNQYTYDYFKSSDHILTDDYYDEILDLSKSPVNRFLLLKLMYGLRGFGPKLEDHFFMEFIASVNHPFIGNLRSQFIRILEQHRFLSKHISALNYGYHFPFMHQLLLSSKTIRSPYHLLKKINVGTFHYTEYANVYKWTGRLFMPDRNSITNVKNIQSFSNKLNLVYRDYLQNLFNIFINNPNNLDKHELHTVFFTLPSNFDEYDTCFKDILPTVLEKARKIQCYFK